MKQVIILGGGIAGLYAALKCSQLGFKVTLVEKRERLGGNIHTVKKDNYNLDTGAGRFNSDHKLLINLLKMYGLTIKELSDKKDFRPVLCSRLIPRFDYHDWIKKIIEKSKDISNELLQSITFIQLCEMILGYEKSKLLIESFGYNAEFLITNAYSSIKTFKEDFTNQYPYYYCTEGLSELVSRIEADLIEQGVTIIKNTSVDNIKEKNGQFKLNVGSRRLVSDFLILALPKSALMTIPFFNNYTKALFDTVVPISLHRIYAKYTTPWFKTIPKFTTDLQLRQFIPIDPDNGFGMVSYSDLFDADYWKYFADQGETQLEEQLKKQLKEIFPSTKIPKMEWVESFYWKEGVHAWLPGVNPNKIRTELTKIHPFIMIVGETYSMRQGWIEGALETVEDAIRNIKKNGSGNSYKKLLKMKESISLKELQTYKENYPDFKWVLLKLPNEEKLRLIDVTEWMYQHPGSAQPFIQHMYKDITQPFKKNSHHFENETLKNHVFKMVKKFTITIVV